MSEFEFNPEKRIALFQRKEIRRVIHNNEWWFVILDVVAALTDSLNPKGYFTDMRRRDPQLAEALKGGWQFATPPLVKCVTSVTQCFLNKNF
jgi:DNA-damage-inducible protein D